MTRIFSTFLSMVVIWALIIEAAHTITGDPDVAWHAETGRYILAHGWPRTDPFSWTVAGEPWIDQEWLWQLVLAGLMHLGGYKAVSLLASFLCVLLWCLLLRYLERWLSFWTAFLLAWAAWWSMAFHYSARPHMAGLVILVIWTGELCTGELRWRLLPLFVLWVQIHGSWALGIVIAAGLGFPEFALICAAASLVNPYGFGYWEMVAWQWRYSGVMGAYIAELRPVDAQHDPLRLALLTAAVCTALSLGVKLGFGRSVVLCAMVLASLRHWRGFAFLGASGPLIVVSAPWLQERSLAGFVRPFMQRWRRRCFLRRQIAQARRLHSRGSTVSPVDECGTIMTSEATLSSNTSRFSSMEDRSRTANCSGSISPTSCPRN
jgi:hypothetical protein